VLAGNLGEDDSTTITDFDDAALDGRLAVFKLRPTAEDWLAWAQSQGIHPTVMKYISLYPERLWDETNINPNPRGWHQVSLAIAESYGLPDEEALTSYLSDNPDGTLSLVIESLLSTVAASDFIREITAPRALSSKQMLEGDKERLRAVASGEIPAEDLLWAASGAISHLRDIAEEGHGNLDNGGLEKLAHVLSFIGSFRADLRVSFFYRIIRDCGLFTRVPAAIERILDADLRVAVRERFGKILEDGKQ
jgi:hypothetical protein